MSNKIARIITPGSATISCSGNTKTFMAGTAEYDKVKELVKAGDEAGLIDLLSNFKNKIESKCKDFRVEDDVVFIKGVDGTEESLPAVLGERLIQFADEGLPYQPIINFWNRLMKNPSYTAVQRLFECLEVNKHPLNSDGKFLAWKKVRSNFRDIHSGKFDNSPGTIVSVRRNQVDEDPDRTCSFGLHVASYDYANNHYGSDNDVLLEVLVDPADVVAVPRDYNSQKLRVCKYEVVQTCKTENKSQLYDYDNYDECRDCGELLDDCCCDDDED